ncbi:MAG TPA: MFS transporter [Jatrophihabitantaceae bacterium]
MSFTSVEPRRNRDLWITILARSISLLGDEAAVVALTLRLHDSGGGTAAIAALFIAGALPLVVCAPLAGRLVDRYDSRVLLVWSGTAQALACTALAYVHSLPTVLVLVAALGVGQSVNGATWAALLPRITGDERLPAAMSLMQSVRTVASIVAPAVGGVLTGLYGARVPLLLDAGTFGLVTLAALLVRTRRRLGRAAAAAQHGGLRVVRDDPVLVVLLSLLAGFIVLGAMVNVIDVFLVRDTLHASATWYGLLAAMWGAGMLLGSLVSRRWRQQDALVRLVLASSAVLSVAMFGYAAAPAVGWIVPVALMGGAANGLLVYGVNTLTMLRATDEVRGRVSATVNGITSAAMIGAFFLGGAIAVVATPRQVFAASAVLGLLAPMASGRLLLRAAASAGGPRSRMLGGWSARAGHRSSSAAESVASTAKATLP